MPKQDIQTIEVKDLHLWTENPRDPVETDWTDYQIIRKAIEDNGKKWNLQKLVQEMGDYYDLSELPTVVIINNKYVVYDANRRIAILKYVQDKELYVNLGGGLFPELEPEELRNLKEIPCNVCNIKTALINIERKHVNNGTWGPLEREYFLHQHRGQDKSLFLMFEEATGLISANKKLNQRFVKEEVITKRNLESVGFKIKNDKLISIYGEVDTKNILDKLRELIETGQIKTRTNEKKGEIRVAAGELKNVMKKLSPELPVKIQEFDEDKGEIINKFYLNPEKNDSTKRHIQRKTPITRFNDQIFGKTLGLKEGKVNNLYLAISTIYEQNKNNKNKIDIILPIVGMSLRLILDVAGREIIGTNDDKAYSKFLKKAKKEMKFLQEDNNFLALTNSWLSNEENLEGIFSKYAHGNIPSEKGNILKFSKIAGEILKFYFKK
jgi:hypothetical protein